MTEKRPGAVATWSPRRELRNPAAFNWGRSRSRGSGEFDPLPTNMLTGRLAEVLERVGRSDEHVVISGAPRRDRERIARFVHASSPRSGSPFVPYDPPTTRAANSQGPAQPGAAGAWIDRAWRRAKGGTLFVVELFELSDPDQAKLLRALEHRDVHAARHSEPVRPVRVIAATSHDLSSVPREESLRASLYHRLNVMSVFVPEVGADEPASERRPTRAAEPLLTFKEEKTRLLETWEPEYLRELLDHSGGNVTVAARLAGIARAHMYRLLKKHRLVR